VTRDELEFSISQYLDGTLGTRERDALDERLATDAVARELYAEYQALQGVLAAAPVPAVDWNAFAARVSGAVAREEMPAQSYKIARWLQPARLAIAASVLVAAGIGFAVLKSMPGVKPTPTPQPTSIVRVDGVPADATVAVVVSNAPVQVVVGPSPDAAKQPIFVRYDDTVVRRPSKALIVSAAPAAQDNPLAPF
jgi:negative regulator of sigma E activity